MSFDDLVRMMVDSDLSLLSKQPAQSTKATIAGD